MHECFARRGLADERMHLVKPIGFEASISCAGHLSLFSKRDLPSTHSSPVFKVGLPACGSPATAAGLGGREALPSNGGGSGGATGRRRRCCSESACLFLVLVLVDGWVAMISTKDRREQAGH